MSVVRWEESLICLLLATSSQGTDNTHWRMHLLKYKLDELLKNVGEFVQGEIIELGLAVNLSLRKTSSIRLIGTSGADSSAISAKIEAQVHGCLCSVCSS